MQKKLKLKPFVLPTLYITVIVAVIVALFVTANNNYRKKEQPKEDYVNQEVIDPIIPVNGENQIGKPFTSDKVNVFSSFYDMKADEEKQKNSIINYQNTYMQNSGIDYSSEETYDIISVLDGTVISVKEDELMGTTVEVKHSGDYISVYQGLSNVTVKKDDVITKGQVIGQSGSSELYKDVKNHLHFELYQNGTIVNPEDHFDKVIAN